MREIEPIARIKTEFPDKFGIPRQSGLVPALTGEIIFEEKYRNAEALRGLEEYSHIWLIWDFSRNHRSQFEPLVTPPRLGGKEKKGVFATRSSFRPNALALSCVKLEEILYYEEGPALRVSGADLMDGTPIYDIKPYLPYTDAHPEALGGFGEKHKTDRIPVSFPENLKSRLPENLRETAEEVLSLDPRSAFQKKPGFRCGLAFAGYDIRFISENEGLRVYDVVPRDDNFTKIKTGSKEAVNKS